MHLIRAQPPAPFKPFTGHKHSTPRTAAVSRAPEKRVYQATSLASDRSAPSECTWLQHVACIVRVGTLAGCLLFTTEVLEAKAAGRKAPPITESSSRCDVSALDKFADTRAKFSQEASGGNMVEAIVDVRGCDFSNKDLSGKVFSGVMMQGANLSNSQVVGSQFARADAAGAILRNVDFTDANCYSTKFDGADVSGAQFENSILTAATFGKDREGNWANLKGAHFEGALLSSSDIGRICENPTLDDATKKFELGCRSTK